MDFGSSAIGLGIVEVEVIHTIKALLVHFWLNFEMACIGHPFLLLVKYFGVVYIWIAMRKWLIYFEHSVIIILYVYGY